MKKSFHTLPTYPIPLSESKPATGHHFRMHHWFFPAPPNPLPSHTKQTAKQTSTWRNDRQQTWKTQTRNSPEQELNGAKPRRMATTPEGLLAVSPPLAQLTCPSRRFLSDSPLRLPGLPNPIKSTSHSRLRLPYVRPRCAVPPLQLQLLPLLLLPVADAPTLTPIYALLPHRSLLAPLLHRSTVPLPPRPPHTHYPRTPGLGFQAPNLATSQALSTSAVAQWSAAREQTDSRFWKNYLLTPPKNDDDDDTTTPPLPSPACCLPLPACLLSAAAATPKRYRRGLHVIRHSSNNGSIEIDDARAKQTNPNNAGRT